MVEHQDKPPVSDAPRQGLLISLLRPPYRWLRHYQGGLGFLYLNFIGHIPSHHIRLALYRLAGMKIGKGSVIYGGAEIRGPRNIVIGEGCIIGHEAKLDGRLGLTLGDNVNFSTGVWIWTMQHDPQSPDFASVGAPVVIEDYAWLSARVIVLPGVRVAKGAVCAAGAVVTKSTEPYSINGGVPSKRIGSRTQDLRYQFSKGGPPMPFV